MPVDENSVPGTDTPRSGNASFSRQATRRLRPLLRPTGELKSPTPCVHQAPAPARRYASADISAALEGQLVILVMRVPCIFAADSKWQKDADIEQGHAGVKVSFALSHTPHAKC